MQIWPTNFFKIFSELYLKPRKNLDGDLKMYVRNLYLSVHVSR